MMSQAAELPGNVGNYVRDLFGSRRLILELTRREFRGRYLGSMFGFIWAFIHPGMMMLIYWFVFRRIGSGAVDGVPFVVWLMSGLIPWFFIAEAISGGSMAVLDNRFLVRKIVFRVSFLPVVRLLTVIPVHLFFVALILALAWGYGFQPTVYCLQLPYYMAAALTMMIGLALLTSALVPFFRDLAQIVQVILQVVFWMMPIVWPYNSVPVKDQWLLMLDPLYYIIRGYRDSLINHVWFWDRMAATVYFWGASAVVLALGIFVFHRLRPQFADVVV